MSKQVQDGYSQSLFQHTQICAQLPAKVHSLFTQVSGKLSLGLKEVLYNILSNINIFPVLK